MGEKSVEPLPRLEGVHRRRRLEGEDRQGCAQKGPSRGWRRQLAEEGVQEGRGTGKKEHLGNLSIGSQMKPLFMTLPNFKRKAKIPNLPSSRLPPRASPLRRWPWRGGAHWTTSKRCWQRPRGDQRRRRATAEVGGERRRGVGSPCRTWTATAETGAREEEQVE